MNSKLKTFKAAAIEMLRSRKARVLFQAAFVGAWMWGGLSLATGQANSGAIAIGCGIGTGVGQAIWETRKIYKRMKSSPLANG